jgi:NADH:ubiquinone oxidoreductase subunit F (NADH-binding)
VIEGNPALPRILGPYQEGLFATDTSPNPTVVNNIETLANLPRILAEGVAAFRAVGTAGSPGTMLFTVVGDVSAPGVYELPLGTPLRTLLVDIAGAQDVKAVYSGTSNAVITPEMLDDPLDFDRPREDAAGIGSGGFVVYDATRPILRVLTTLSGFLARESCGQCNPCKLGTATITELLASLCRGQGDERTVETIWRRTAMVTDGNRCYLPVGEQLMVGSTLTAYAEEISAGLGRPVPEADLPVPLVDDIDLATGEVTYSR